MIVTTAPDSAPPRARSDGHHVSRASLASAQGQQHRRRGQGAAAERGKGQGVHRPCVSSAMVLGCLAHYPGGSPQVALRRRFLLLERRQLLPRRRAKHVWWHLVAHAFVIKHRPDVRHPARGVAHES